MFNWLRNLFEDNSIPSVTFIEFYRKLTSLKQVGIYPYEYNLPQAINFSEVFWKEIIDIHKMTLKDGLEREISVFSVDGDLIFTSVVKGNENSVKSGHNVSVKYVPHPTRKGYFRKEIYLDGSIYKRIDVYYKKVPKKIVVEYLFNLHTHPKHVLENNEVYFSFVSKQDIVSLLQSNAIVTGLVTDRLWLFVRTDKTPDSILMDEKDITVESLKINMKIVIYMAEFFKKGIRQ